MADITLVVDGNLFGKLVNFDASPEEKESSLQWLLDQLLEQNPLQLPSPL
jgi:hypothetical protein